MKIPVLFLSWDRLGYTTQAFEALRKTDLPIDIWWWDNGSTDGTQDFARNQHLFGHVADLHLSGRNVGMNAAVNAFLRANRHAPWVAKVDNDTLVEPDWLTRLLDAAQRWEMDALSAWHWRPEGPAGTFADWSKGWPRSPDGRVAYHDYCGGTACLLRMDYFRQHGLLCEQIPSMLGDLTLHFRSHFTGKNVGWHLETFARLLDLQHDNGPVTGDVPAYEAQVSEYRRAGNEWWTRMGGVPGISAWIAANGGRERL